jgi:hypothetical protein
MGGTSVVGLVRAHELALSAIVAVGFLVPMGIVFLVASAFTRGHGVVLREGGLVRTTGRDALKIRYEDIQRVAVGAGRSAAYEVRFSPLYEHDFSLASRAELDRLLAALAAKGVRVEAPERF